MNIAIASGKGGTGKTTVAVNLAYTLFYYSKEVKLFDCDVEEPNDHLFIKEKLIEEFPVLTHKPLVDQKKCDACGLCAKACKYNALALVKGKLLIFNKLCHSCGLCFYLCPKNALSKKEVLIGTVKKTKDDKNFTFIHGELNLGQTLTPKVISSVKKYIDKEKINIIDASPGTTCPVVEAIKDSDITLLVTEPTIYGLNDLKLAVNLCVKLGLLCAIVINRSDKNDCLIEKYASKANIPIIGKIPFERKYAEAYSEGEILVDRFSELRNEFYTIFEKINLVKKNPPKIQTHFERAALKNGELGDLKKSSFNHNELTVISGKGGTGKTTIVSALSKIIPDKVLADCDVDASDLHLLLNPITKEVYDFIGGMKSEIDINRCVLCGRCKEVCAFEAIKISDGKYVVDGLSCEGCSYCSYVCEYDAIKMKQNVSGRSMISETSEGYLSHAILGIAEENSGKLVSKVRKTAAQLASHFKKDTILSDGPPGVGCPVIASITGTQLVLIVVEPTLSGIHDMERVLKLTKHFGVKSYILINKADLNLKKSKIIEEIAGTYFTKVLGRVPFDRSVHDSLVEGKNIMDWAKGSAFKAIKDIGELIKNLIREDNI